LARRRGGSSVSKRSTSFFPRILKHFVAFRMGIGNECVGLQGFGIGLHPMSPFQHSLVREVQFTRQLCTRLALLDTGSRAHGLRRGEDLKCLKEEFQVFQAFLCSFGITHKQRAHQAIE
jgi:hypothetical protein